MSRRTRPGTLDEYKRNHNLNKKYGIDNDYVDILWIVQQGKCHICKINMTWPAKTKGQKSSAMCVDHDHNTGEVRGLLCGSCNKGIGALKDDPDLLEAARRYLLCIGN